MWSSSARIVYLRKIINGGRNDLLGKTLLKGRLAIIDPSLKDERGHHYALTKAISDGALKNGLDVLIFANRNVTSLPELNKVEIFPVFSSTTYDIFIKANVKQPSVHYIKILGLLPPSLLSRLKSFKKKFMSLLRGDIFSAMDRSREGLPLHEELLLAIKQHKLSFTLRNTVVLQKQHFYDVGSRGE